MLEAPTQTIDYLPHPGGSPLTLLPERPSGQLSIVAGRGYILYLGEGTRDPRLSNLDFVLFSDGAG